MSFIIKGPIPGYNTAIVLPSPQFSDGERQRATLNLKTALDGTKYTYVKKTGRRVLSYSFETNRAKAEEMKRFLQAYGTKQMLITDHKDQHWQVWLTTNPFEMDFTGPDERTRFQLEFSGVRA